MSQLDEVVLYRFSTSAVRLFAMVAVVALAVAMTVVTCVLGIGAFVSPVARNSNGTLLSPWYIGAQTNYMILCIAPVLFTGAFLAVVIYMLHHIKMRGAQYGKGT